MEKSDCTCVEATNPDKAIRLLTHYQRLGKGLLYYLACELGYFFLIFILITISALFFAESHTSFLQPGILITIVSIPLLIAFIGNLICGFSSLVITIIMDYQGIPPIGLFLNWLLIISTSWIFIFVIYLILPKNSGWSGE
jgi:hypothetical protein